MISVLETDIINSDEPTIEETVLYDYIPEIIEDAHTSFNRGDFKRSFRAYITIKVILILFEACDLTDDARYWICWEWLEAFSEELLPKFEHIGE